MIVYLSDVESIIFPRWTIHATVTAVRELREFNTSRSGKVFSVHLTDESVSAFSGWP